MGTAILAGRDFDERRDTANSGKVGDRHDSFARHFFKGQNPIGQSFQIDVRRRVSAAACEIVGVVQDTSSPISASRSVRSGSSCQGVRRISRRSLKSPDRRAVDDDHVGSAGAVAVNSDRPSVRHDAEPGARVLTRERLMATPGFFGALAGLIATIGLSG
jgi:hypothetical protein